MMYGLPNSVMMLDISLQTAELVEHGHFLTIKIWRSNHLRLRNQYVSSRTNLCLGYAKHLVEFHFEHWEVSFEL